MTKKSTTPSTTNTTANSAPAEDTNPASFESAMAELAQLVTRMETGELTLEESVEAYKKGSGLVRYCAQQLEKVEQQVSILDGEALKPFQIDVNDMEN